MEKRVVLKGSYREPSQHAVKRKDTSIPHELELSVVLRRRDFAGDKPLVTHDNFAEVYGAAAEDIGAVDTFCAQHGLTVTSVHEASRTLKISGGYQSVVDAFEAELWESESGEVTRKGHLTVPEYIDGIIVGVFGFDQRPQARTHHRVQPKDSGAVSYLPKQVAEAYGFPANTGAGQTVAILELGGGYKESDLEAYWKLAGVPPVSVTSVAVDGVGNAPTGDPNGDDGEVCLDIQVIGGIAPAASIVVYFAPNTDKGYIDCLNAIVHDATHKPKVLSISWGGPESTWTGQSMNAINVIFDDAAKLGITVFAASGDSGADDGVGDGKQHVDFPASSPCVLGCGGTSLRANGATIESEVVWNDGANGGASGGGFSTVFARPMYFQAGINQHGHKRGVPDVAAVADPDTGYVVIIDGEKSVIGGTSAAAPAWAALIALCNQELATSAGWISEILYLEDGPEALRDITEGNNSVPGVVEGFSAGVGWDACCGLGSPDGQKILALLKEHRGTAA